MRLAIMSLQNHTEGSSSKKLKMSAAYHEIASARYADPARNLTLKGYIQRHYNAHTEIIELGELVSECKKVEDFMKGLTNLRLRTSK